MNQNELHSEEENLTQNYEAEFEDWMRILISKVFNEILIKRH